jgi:GDP-mannose transporter
MDDKKNEDYAIKMPEQHEMRNFSGRSSPSSGREPFLSSQSGSGKAGGLHLPVSNITNSPPISILAYCLASISMTVTNKYCVSGANWNLNFFYLAIQVYPQHLPNGQCLERN